jgi:leucyl-tRNA synthetase
MKRYNPKEIEPKWQQVWADTQLYAARDNDTTSPKAYVLDFFPYPSGAAMHVGHVRNYALSDTIARYKRMTGHNVLHPMGWDAFGLPAENYAIKTGISPQQAIEENTTRFRQQLTQMGMGIDWSREFSSSDPKYYKWTQWLFLLLFKRGLAYQEESLQWWCPVDKTVLANEQVEAGRCWRCGNEVYKKPLKQWFFKITDYADRLDADLADIDWSDAIKAMQHNWIGRSVGAEVDFKVKDSDETIKIFTTRVDTLFGATFMVLAPEHPMVKTITTPDRQHEVDAYVAQTLKKSDIDRMETNREKTGTFTGAYAINPVNQKEIPIWIADYVLTGYGTGAIMAVPAHDVRDHAFAQKFGLPIIEVVEPETGTPQDNPEFRESIVAIVHNPKTDKYLSLDWGKLGGNLFIGGGREAGEDIEKAARREIAEETGYTDLTLKGMTSKIYHNYYAHSKNVARRIEAYGLLFELDDDVQHGTALEKDEEGKFKVRWVPANEVETKVTDELHSLCFDLLVGGECYHGEGIMINSGDFNGMSSSEAREQIVKHLDKKHVANERTNYRMRDWLISRQRYWGAPIPIIHCPEHGVVAVPEKDLPVVLPEMKSYQPSDDGRSPLARVEEWVKTTCPECGKEALRETDTMDGFACSSWYFCRFADPHNDTEPFDRQLLDYWLPVDTYVGGAEHAVMHLLYARFWTKVMYDAGLVGFTEPFTSLRNQGMILAPDGQKMSKSKGNVIAPDDLIENGYGADSIRVMEMFIAPWNQASNWSTEGLGGCFRFLQRVWTITQEYLEADHVQAEAPHMPPIAIERAMHKAIKRATVDFERMSPNTAVAGLMEYVNELYKLKVEIPFASSPSQWRDALSVLAQLLAPFAPHITEELWGDLGHDDSVHVSAWPQWDQSLVVDETVTVVIQVNGKVRANVPAARGATEVEVVDLALRDDHVRQYVGDKPPVKVIFVPNRLVNFVVK